MDEPTRAERPHVSRRDVLRGAAVAGVTLAAGLAAGTRPPTVQAQWRPRGDVGSGDEVGRKTSKMKSTTKSGGKA